MPHDNSAASDQQVRSMQNEQINFEISGKHNHEMPVVQDHFSDVFKQPLRQLSMLANMVQDALPIAVSASLAWWLFPAGASAATNDLSSVAQQLYQHHSIMNMDH